MAVLGLAADIAHGLVQQDGDLLLLAVLGGAVDLDASLGTTNWPITATSPLTLTQPFSTHSSASRREHMPISAMRLLMRASPGRASSRGATGSGRMIFTGAALPPSASGAR
jgi:hypothetical protein